MTSTYTTTVKDDGDWWIGWIEEVPGVNAQEKSKAALLQSLRRILREESVTKRRGDKKTKRLRDQKLKRQPSLRDGLQSSQQTKDEETKRQKDEETKVLKNEER